MDGAFDTYWQQPSTSTEQVENIQNALRATLDPRIPNDVRQQALQHLEQIRTQPDAPHHGFTLADDWTQDNSVRYYGLQLLEFAVKYRWSDYSNSQTEQLRTWVKCLAGSVREQDALYIRNKIAQLWVEVAKRCWGEEWRDMDQQMVTLWDKPASEKGMAIKTLVLYILETLSEDVMQNEDSAAGLRLEVLGSALNDIIVPQGLYLEHASTRGSRQEVRYGEQGWLARICDFFAECVKQSRIGGSVELLQSMSACAVRALNALRPTMSWISLKAVAEVQCVDCLFLPFHTEDAVLQAAATEVLYALFSRPFHTHWQDAWANITLQALRPDRVSLMRRTFQHTALEPGQDDVHYTLQKKMSEVLSLLADGLGLHPHIAANKLDLPSFFELLVYVLQSKSLVVSIPILHSFSKMMSVQDDAIIDLIFQALGTLVQTCSERLLRYETLPDDSDDEIVQYLNEDFDTVPERHAFLGNYRRYCISIIQSTARYRPLEALSHVLEQMRTMIQDGPYTTGRGFNSATYSRNTLAVLQFDAQFNVVSSALKGFSLWCSDVAALPAEEPLAQKAEQDHASATQSMQQWSYNVINMHVDDPIVAALILQTMVAILRTIKASSDFILHVVQHLLTMRLYDNSAHTTFSDAVKAFEWLRVVELQKLALAYPNELLDVYYELEPRIGVLAQKHEDDQRLVWGYKAFLFMIIHRATGVDSATRMMRLQQLLNPVYEAWQDESLGRSVESLDSFCDSLGLGGLADFYKAYHFDQVQDWSAQQLDEAGQARQQGIKDKNEHLPLRMTKSMLAATTEKLKMGTQEADTACALWGSVIPVILPRLLQLVRHAQAFHNMSNWSQLPPELQIVVKRTLQDRFWQSGISNESKDEFYARISGSKTSYEGFASVVRGTMRNIREQGYHIIYLLAKFEEQFFGLPDLAEPLAHALFDDAEALSANNLHPVINLATGLVQRCPPSHRASFLPPLLIRLFNKLDAKISSEWEALDQASQQSAEEDDLSDEMRVESVLRQLTYSMVSFVPFLLEYDRTEPRQQTNGHQSTAPSLGDLILGDPSVLEPLILFCTHALRMRDTRCCSTICKVFRSIVPLFTADESPAPQVREFISTEVLKACITSLNEPYFADLQRDLAAVIAQILLLYAPKTNTPRDVLLSLPDMSAAKVDKVIAKIIKTQNERQQRALVLELLDGVRGVSIYEAGKISRDMPKKTNKTTVQQQYMEVEQRHADGNGVDVGLESVAGLFGDA